jgi:GTP-binding protein
MRTPLIAVVGCPNAGKSTLINRLSGTRTAVVHETPGVTRDRKQVVTEWRGRQFGLVDTGGFASDDATFANEIREQVLAAVREADLILFVVDAQGGPLAGDFELADVLRRARLPVLVVANKVDNPRRENETGDLYRLGLGDPLPVSALHGTGTGDLLDRIAEVLDEAGLSSEEQQQRSDTQEPTAVAIVGRPNAGKSSLFNAIVGEARTIVSEIPGTTRDAIDVAVENRHGRFLFVDTAGMRKAAKVSGVEYYAYLRSLQSLDRAHVAIVVADATLGLGELDVSIAAEAAKRGCATVLALNKWDLAQPPLSEVAGTAARKLRQRPAVVPVSALTGRGVGQLLERVAAVGRGYASRLPTAVLNRAMAVIVAERAGPARAGRRLKVYYVTQYQTAPPRFSVGVNDRSLVTRDYGYFVENRLRTAFGLEGVPLIIDFKTT